LAYIICNVYFAPCQHHAFVVCDDCGASCCADHAEVCITCGRVFCIGETADVSCHALHSHKDMTPAIELELARERNIA
jgi:hypothetical protein